ncbi:MAG: PQQ-binding-like beta-propeller repeat protein [Bryobacteraceae bacterium]|nr:PQQ-binding-like beta-propeller repeat protein [Bryobacteraceae bacterium]
MWLIVVLMANLMAADWPRFRGPNGTGVAEAKNLPVEFGKEKNLKWRVEVPGGTSSPIVSAGRIFLTAFEKDDRLLLCLDAGSGKLLWKQATAKERTEAAHSINGPVTPTPASDGENVYVFFPEVGLMSWDHNGKQRWKTPLGPFSSIQGLAGSPIVVDGVVVLLIDQAQGGWVAGFDASTGRQRWKAERPSTVWGGYTTPLVYRPKSGPAQVIVFASLETTGYQASTGERLWWMPGLGVAPAASPSLVGEVLYTNQTYGAEISAPFSVWAAMDKNKNGKIEREEVKDAGLQRLIFGADAQYGNNDGVLEAGEWNRFDETGRDSGGLVALQLGGRGDLSKSAPRWRVTKSVPYLTASVVYDGVLYTIRDGGILAAIDPVKGEVLKQGRVEGALDKYYASPVAGDGKLYLTSEAGKVAVVKAGGDWRTLAVADLDEPAYATPALIDGRVIVRTRKALYCFGQ